MLQSMHEKIQGWLARALITVVCLSFALWGVQSYLHGGFGSHNNVAKVGSETITKQQFAMNFSRARRSYEAKHGVMSDAMIGQFKHVILQEMIQKTAFREALKELGFSYSDPQVRAIIKDSPAFKENGVFSSARLAAYLRQSNQTIDSFAANMGQRLLQMQFQSGVVGSAIATPLEVEQFGQWITQRRDYRYFVIQPDSLVVPPPSKKAIQDYYKNNSSQFIQPEQIAVDYIALTPKQASSYVTVTSRQIKAYYNDNQTMFRAPLEYHVVSLPVGSKKGLLTESKARKYSQSANAFEHLAKRHGGKSQWLAYSKLDKAMQAKLGDLLSKPSPQLLTIQGKAKLVLILGKRQGGFLPLSAVKKRIKNQLQSQGVSRVLAKKQEQLTNLAYINAKHLAPVAKAVGLDVKRSSYFSKQGGSGVFADPSVVRAAWSDNVRIAKNNSNVIHLADGSLVVLRLRAQKARQALPLASVSAQIKTRLLHQSRELQASLFALKLAKLANAQDAKQLLGLMREHKLNWVAEKNISRQQKVSMPLVRKKAFSLKRGEAQSVPLPNGGSAVVQAVTIRTLSPKELRALPAYRAIKKSVSGQYARPSAFALLDSLIKAIPVDVDEKALS